MRTIARLAVPRFLGAFALLAILSILIFALQYLAPGNLVNVLLGFDLDKVSPETIAAVRAQYRLDDPLIVQYLSWLGRACRGDFGNSIRYQTQVTSVVFERAGTTALLAVLSFGLAVLVAIPLGIACAVRSGGALDRFVVATSVFVGSAPSFALSLLLIFVFGLELGWLPIYGIGGGGLDTLEHLALPAITLALGLSATLVKLTRTSVIRELDQDYITFARARGLRRSTVHAIALRNAAIPVVTGAGLTLTYLIGGAVLVETVFALPGLGVLLQDAVLYRDVPVVQFLTLLLATLIVAVAFLVDLVYLALDPRIRRGKEPS